MYASLWLRFDGNVPVRFMISFQDLILPYTFIMILVFTVFGLYHRLWQYATTEDLLSLAGAITIGIVLFFLFTLLLSQEEYLLPRSVFIISWLLNFCLIGFSRLTWKFYRGNLSGMSRNSDLKPALIVGAGDAGAIIARELKNHAGTGYDISFPVGFVDDDMTKKNQKMCGLPVLGNRRDIPKLVENYKISEVIIAMPSAPSSVVREVVDICYKTGVQLKIVPGLYELIDGRVSISQVREVQVEDLLDRAPVKVDLDSIAGYLKDRIVLVTGAGGSIGSELCRQIARFYPRKLIILDHSENSIYDIYSQLTSQFSSVIVDPVVADIKDEFCMQTLFSKTKPHVVFHAAAHKHVPLVEQNAAEAVKNNILGTWNIVQAAHCNEVEACIFISTDKAVNPTSIMGATKRIAEMLVQSIASNSNTRFAAVRFGNVLDSRGSVVPLFKRQILEGGPITVTHPEMTRYFMTIPEAVQLVIQAGTFADNGEVFVLDMGEPIKVLDLARKMIKLAGLRPQEDIEIVFTGVRPGEKLHEELHSAEEGFNNTWHHRIYVVFPQINRKRELQALIEEIKSPEWSRTTGQLEEMLQRVIPEFRKGGQQKKQKVLPEVETYEKSYQVFLNQAK